MALWDKQGKSDSVSALRIVPPESCGSKELSLMGGRRDMGHTCGSPKWGSKINQAFEKQCGVNLVKYVWKFVRWISVRVVMFLKAQMAYAKVLESLACWL